MGRAQAPHRLTSRWCSFFNPLFKRSKLHCLDICLTWYLWHVKVWWECLHWQSTPRYATIPGPILFKRSRLNYLHVCWRVICDIYKFDYGTHLQGVNTTQVCTIPILICWHVVSVLLNIWWWCVGTSPNSSSIPTHCTCGQGLCLWSLTFLSSALVCDLLPRLLFHGFAKGALPEESLGHNFEDHCLDDTGLIWCLSYPSEEAPLIPGRYVSW